MRNLLTFIFVTVILLLTSISCANAQGAWANGSLGFSSNAGGPGECPMVMIGNFTTGEGTVQSQTQELCWANSISPVNPGEMINVLVKLKNIGIDDLRDISLRLSNNGASSPTMSHSFGVSVTDNFNGITSSSVSVTFSSPATIEYQGYQSIAYSSNGCAEEMDDDDDIFESWGQDIEDICPGDYVYVVLAFQTTAGCALNGPGIAISSIIPDPKSAEVTVCMDSIFVNNNTLLIQFEHINGDGDLETAFVEESVSNGYFSGSFTYRIGCNSSHQELGEEIHIDPSEFNQLTIRVHDQLLANPYSDDASYISAQSEVAEIDDFFTEATCSSLHVEFNLESNSPSWNSSFMLEVTDESADTTVYIVYMPLDPYDDFSFDSIFTGLPAGTTYRVRISSWVGCENVYQSQHPSTSLPGIPSGDVSMFYQVQDTVILDLEYSTDCSRLWDQLIVVNDLTGDTVYITDSLFHSNPGEYNLLLTELLNGYYTAYYSIGNIDGSGVTTETTQFYVEGALMSSIGDITNLGVTIQQNRHSNVATIVSDTDLDFHLINLNGQILNTYQIQSGNRITIDLNTLSKGMYFLSTFHIDQVYTEKIVIL